MQKEFSIKSLTGIHARPAKKIVETALGYPFDIYLVKKSERYSAKSLVAMISIGAQYGDQIIVAAEGDEAEAAIEAIGLVLASEH